MKNHNIEGGIRMVRKIVEKVPDKVLQKDLEKYRQRAIELGATDAKIITSDMILIDERVRVKCIQPKCEFYGTNANCPPHAIDLDLLRKVVNNFRYAIFIFQKVPSEEMCGTDWQKSAVRSAVKLFKLVSKIESEAFYDGYHLATGFGSGPCILYFCQNQECLVLSGQACRHPSRARSAMEGVGIDVFTMAAKVGWDVYPIGLTTQPSEVPHASRLGLVLIY